ncbi:unnamed protein product [Leptidea sinapis]|uniref:Uncharacterized protein n=1 Tax=Leptidea sinapis TaxID=189913 RepID=A0A5E4QTG5_9NEOP|nr:unnamed protein product [Leptidea sinapis]
MAISDKYNTKCPGVKRLMREALELAEATEEYCARPLEDNLFEWHFTVRGPPGTDFEGGHHPETWQPSWSIRTALLALIAFMPTPSEGEEEQAAKPPEEPTYEPEPQVLESVDSFSTFLDQLLEIIVALLVGAIAIFIYRRWNTPENTELTLLYKV